MTLFILTFNRSVLSIAAMLMNLRIMNEVFEKRHRIALWAVYFSTKAVATSFFDACIYLGVENDVLNNMRLVVILVTAVASYGVLYYTWQGDFLNIGCTAICSDIVTGTSFFITSGIINTVTGKKWDTTFIGFSTTETFCSITLAVLFFILLLRLIMPVLRYLRCHRFHRSVFWAAVIIVLITALTSSQIIDVITFTFSQYIVLVVFFILLTGITIFLSVKIPRTIIRRNVLRQQASLTNAYNQSVRAQTEDLYAQQHLLTELSEQIQENRDRYTDDMQNYLKRMKDYLEQLRGGLHSADPATNAILTAFAERFQTLGIRTVFRAGSLSESEGQPAELAGILLQWAETVFISASTDQAQLLHTSLLKDHGGKQHPSIPAEHSGKQYPSIPAEHSGKQYPSISNDSDSVRSVDLRLFQRRNQLILILRITGVKRRSFPRALLRDYITRRHGVLQETWKEGVKTIRLMTEVIQ